MGLALLPEADHLGPNERIEPTALSLSLFFTLPGNFTAAYLFPIGDVPTRLPDEVGKHHLRTNTI